MTQKILAPSTVSPPDLIPKLKEQGYAVVDGHSVADFSGCELKDLQVLSVYWLDLPADAYLKDGGHYRRRRHSCYKISSHEVLQVSHRPHWQPVEYNALHGGMQRLFEPIQSDLSAQRSWRGVLSWLSQVASSLKGEQDWFVEAHQFRIDTAEGIGRPTPEGAHRDGVDLVAVFLVERQGIKGGETRVFDAEGSSGERFTLTEPWSVLLLDDERVIHESTPIQPIAPDTLSGYRDTLVVTLRSKSFQGN